LRPCSHSFRVSIPRCFRWPALLAGPILLAAAGCAGPGPKLLPPAPIQERIEADGSGESWFDTNNNARKDYCEVYSGGRLTEIRYDCDEDGQTEETVVLDQVPTGERRYLVMLLDSVRFDVAENLWQRGRFRYCTRPARVISPFPVMTDLSFSEFFGVSPCPGIESEYYDGHTLKNGYFVYAQEGNANWAPRTDYHLRQFYHAFAYLDVQAWYGHELRRVQETFLRSDQRMIVTYCVGSSAQGASEAFNGHEAALVSVDRMCRELIRQTHGRARFALLSDHGLYFTPQESQLVVLREMFARFGYHVTDKVRGPRDVVIPEFEMVSVSSVNTQTPAPVARDALGIAGVELAMYMDGEELVVLSKTGRAAIRKSATGYRYAAQFGDPLELKPILDKLHAAGKVDAEGFAEDQALFEATLQHVYPDPAARLWRAFHGLVQYTPEVILSLADGFHTGSKLQTDMINMVGVHGNPRQISSSGFAMTSEGGLPADIRMEDLRAALRALGVPLEVGR
jgi:hypothetical protein